MKANQEYTKKVIQEEKMKVVRENMVKVIKEGMMRVVLGDTMKVAPEGMMRAVLADMKRVVLAGMMRAAPVGMKKVVPEETKIKERIIALDIPEIEKEAEAKRNKKDPENEVKNLDSDIRKIRKIIPEVAVNPPRQNNSKNLIKLNYYKNN